MIQKISLKNFKTHVDSSVTFDQLTSLIGSSDNGKTNIIRALKIVLFNEDWPATWITYGKSESSIEVELANGYLIKRSRTKKAQSCTITKPDGEVINYAGKNDLGELIASITGCNKVLLDENVGLENLNWMQVLDPPYLLGASAIAVQRRIAGLLGISRLEEARGVLSKEVKKLARLKSEVQEELDRASQTFISADHKFQAIEQLLNHIEDLNQQLENLESKLQQVNNFINQFGTSTINTVELGSFSTVLNSNSQTFAKLLELESKLRKHLQIKPTVIDLTEVEVLKGTISKLNKLNKDLKTFLEDQLENINKQTKLKLDNLESRKSVIIKQLKRCPACGK